MPYNIYKIGDNTPVAHVSCGRAEFHPKVSTTASSILNGLPVGTIVYVKEDDVILWTGVKRHKRLITDKV